MTKFLSFLFCGLMSVAGCSQKLTPDDGNVCSTPIASGTTGTLTWVLCKNGTLTISGEGEMPDYLIYNPDGYESQSQPSWYKYRENIISVIIGDAVSHIGDFAFFGHQNLTSITIGSSVSSIGEGSLYGCHVLTNIVNYQETPQFVRATVHVDTDPYFGAVNKSKCTIWVPAGSVEAYRTDNIWKNFYKYGVIGDPESITICGEARQLTWTLNDDGVLTVSGTGEMPDYGSLYAVRPWDGFRDNIVSVVIEDGVSRIGHRSFIDFYNLTSLIIANTVTTIGSSAFSGCVKLTSIDIPNSVTTIYGSFIGCRGLKSATIGNSVAVIDYYTFIGCVGLTEIINYQETPQIIIGEYIDEYGHICGHFASVNKSNCTLYVPSGAIEAYRVAEGWKEFVNIKEIQ